MPFLQDLSFDNTLEGAQQKSEEFNKFKTGKKAEFSAKKPEIERLYSQIAALLSKNKRPEFAPPSGLSLSDIGTLWDHLEEEERKKEDSVSKELARQEKLSVLVRRFQSEAEDLEIWIAGKEKYLNQKEDIDTLFKAQFAVKLSEAFTEELNAREPRLQGLNELKSEIVGLNYVQADTISARADKLTSSWDNLKQLSQTKKASLQEELSVQQKKENLRIDFAQQAKEFSKWVKDSNERIGDYNFGFTLEAVSAHRDELNKSNNEFNTVANDKKASIEKIWNEMQSAGVTDNAHTALTLKDVENFFGQLQTSLSNRNDAYEKELERQKVFEDKRKEFAEKANAFISYLAEQRALLEKIEGEPQQKIVKINEIKDGSSAKQQIDDISALASQMASMGIYGNKHTQFSLPSLNSRHNQFNNYITSLISALSEEKEMQERIHAQEVELAQKEKAENMILQFSRLTGDLVQWMENGEEILGDSISVDSIEDAEKLLAEFNDWQKHTAAKQAQHKELSDLAATMKAEGITDFSGVTIEEINDKWNNVSAGSDERKIALEKELARQKSNDTIRRNFAEKAKSFNNWLVQQKEALVAKGSLEEQLSVAQAQRIKLGSEGKEQLSAVEEINKSAEAAGIKNYKYTDLSLRTLRVEFEQLEAANDKQEKLLTNEIMMKKNADVTAEQLAEFKDVFHYFDRDGNGTLQRKELKACLQSLGEEPTVCIYNYYINLILCNLVSNIVIGPRNGPNYEPSRC
jgi:hypothetical protein